MLGELIVFEGLDGSGKETQANCLAQSLEQDGKSVMKISFPVYDSPSSSLVKMYLFGKFGTDPCAVNAYAASSFFAVDRYASYRTNWGPFYQGGGTVIADRYTTSNAIHQCSKLPEEQWEGYLDWLFTYEYKYLEIPAPDRIIYLQTDVDVCEKLILSRYDGHEDQRDIHEGNLEYLRRSKKAAEFCAERLGWTTVRCTSGGKMRSVGDIQHEVRKLLSAF